MNIRKYKLLSSMESSGKSQTPVDLSDYVLFNLYSLKEFSVCGGVV